MWSCYGYWKGTVTRIHYIIIFSNPFHCKIEEIQRKHDGGTKGLVDCRNKMAKTETYVKAIDLASVLGFLFFFESREVCLLCRDKTVGP